MSPTIFHRFYVIILILLTVGCVSAPKPNTDILGTWRGDISGIEATLVISDDTISIEGFGMNMAYRIAKGILSIDTPSQGTMQYHLIVDEETMVHEDVHSDAVYVFQRVLSE